MNNAIRAKLFWVLLGIFFVYAVSITFAWSLAMFDGLHTGLVAMVVAGAYLPLILSLLFWIVVRDWRRGDTSADQLRKVLEAEELQAESVLAALDEGVLIMNRDGIVKYMNMHMSDMMASTEQYMVGRHFSKLMNEHVNIVSSSARKPRLSHNVVQVFESGEPVLIEHERLSYPDTGAYRDVVISLLPIKNTHGEVSALMIVGRDISGLIRVHEKEDEFLVKAGQRLAGGLQPALEQLNQMREVPDMNEPLAAKVADAQLSLVRLKQLIDDVQIHTTLTLNQYKKELKFVEVADIFATASAKVAKRYADKYVTISRDIAVSSIIVDEQQFQIVVDQLLDNAYKFSPDKDTVLLRIVTDGTTAVLEVTDNGVGISDEQRATIFEPFAKDYDPSVQDSTGLGMSICKKIIDDWGGEIKISSQEVGGVVMTCTIPGALREGEESDDTLAPSYLESVDESGAAS